MKTVQRNLQRLKESLARQKGYVTSTVCIVQHFIVNVVCVFVCACVCVHVCVCVCMCVCMCVCVCVCV